MTTKQVAIICLIITILLRALNPILFKQAALSMDSFSAVNVLTNTLYWLGFGILFIRSVTWQLVLRGFDLSTAYPFMSISLIIMLIAGYLIYNETITWTNGVGASIMIVGLIFISKRQRTE